MASSFQKFAFSQNSFDGWLACTAIATCAACGFADNEASLEKYRTYCDIGSQMWKSISSSTISVQQVLDHYVFFNNTYKVESYQCCLQNNLGEDNPKFISLKILMNTAVNELGSIGSGSDSFGMVFTDGAASFACGYKNRKWWIFDSHITATLWCGDQAAAEERIRQKVCMGIVDCTTFSHN